ncbi:MAG: hypothetical protein ACREPR_23460 [Brasilonema sp.]
MRGSATEFCVGEFFLQLLIKQSLYHRYKAVSYLRFYHALSFTWHESLIWKIQNSWSDEYVALYLGDSLEHYVNWEKPTVIISDGGYGVLGFEGDTSNHFDLPEWYEPHIETWSKLALPNTTLWFWNSEIGWAVVHPLLEKHGWRYVNCNIWNKGKGHI